MKDIFSNWEASGGLFACWVSGEKERQYKFAEEAERQKQNCKKNNKYIDWKYPRIQLRQKKIARKSYKYANCKNIQLNNVFICPATDQLNLILGDSVSDLLVLKQTQDIVHFQGDFWPWDVWSQWRRDQTNKKTKTNTFSYRGNMWPLRRVIRVSHRRHKLTNRKAKTNTFIEPSNRDSRDRDEEKCPDQQKKQIRRQIHMTQTKTFR